jgi:hypothetical protein
LTRTSRKILGAPTENWATLLPTPSDSFLCRSFQGQTQADSCFDRYDVYKKMQAKDLLLEDHSLRKNLIMHPLKKDRCSKLVFECCQLVNCFAATSLTPAHV